MIWTVQWMTGTVTTGVKQATVYPHATTVQLSRTPQYTSTQWDPVFSNTQTPAQTLCTVLSWTTETINQAGTVNTESAVIRQCVYSLHISKCLRWLPFEARTMRLGFWGFIKAVELHTFVVLNPDVC